MFGAPIFYAPMILDTEEDEKKRKRRKRRKKKVKILTIEDVKEKKRKTHKKQIKHAYETLGIVRHSPGGDWNGICSFDYDIILLMDDNEVLLSNMEILPIKDIFVDDVDHEYKLLIYKKALDWAAKHDSNLYLKLKGYIGK